MHLIKQLSLLLGVAICWTTTTWGQEWEIEFVGIGTKPELALDSQGQPHIAYMTEDLVGDVFYAWRTEAEWDSEIVATGYFYAPMDLAIDSDDQPHIAYHDHDFEDGAYAVKQNGAWQVELIPDSGHDGWDPSIALGPDGEVYVVSIDPSQFGSTSGVEWAMRTPNGTWSVGEVGSGPIPYEFGTAVAVDSEGTLHIAYHNGSDRFNEGNGSDLYYGINTGGGWQLEPVDEEGDVGKFPSLVIDSQDRPHIAYFHWDGPTSGQVKYAFWDGTTWQIEEVDHLFDIQISFLGARRVTSLALDAAGQPHIAYADRQQMHYAAKAGESWDIQIVTGPSDASKILGQLASLALDEDGRPHLTYYELPDNPSNSTGDIFYAVGQIPTAVADDENPLPETSDLAQNFPNPFNANTTIRYTLPAAAPVRLTIYNQAGQQIRQLVDGPAPAGTHTVSWDGTNAQGQPAATGTYLSRLEFNNTAFVRKMTLLR